MTDPVYTDIDRADVIAALGRQWPPAPGARCLVVTGCTDGTVAVYPQEGRPGLSYWVVDGAVPPQDMADLVTLAGQLAIDPDDAASWVVPVPVEDPTTPPPYTPVGDSE